MIETVLAAGVGAALPQNPEETHVYQVSFSIG